MKNNLVVLLTIATILAASTQGCGRAPKTAPPSDQPPTPVATEAADTFPDGVFVANQLMVVGSDEYTGNDGHRALEEALSDCPELGFPVKLENIGAAIALGALRSEVENERDLKSVGKLAALAAAGPNQELELYLKVFKIDGGNGRALEKIVSCIAQKPGLPVVASPNWIVRISEPLRSFAALPEATGTGSSASSEPTAAPHGPKPVPLTEPPPKNNQFSGQHMFTSMNAPLGSLPSKGTNVPVAVIDTSPFTDLGPVQVNPGASMDFELNNIPASSALSTNTGDGINIANHGLFIAGIVHTFAPESKITLYQALNDYGHGDLAMTLGSAAAFNLANPGPGVINMSASWFGGLSACGAAASKSTYGNDPAEVALALLRQDQKIAVAASGNDSSSANILNWGRPADSAHVIGVTGSTSGNSRSCFANCGEIAAAAGDGNPNALPDGTPACSVAKTTANSTSNDFIISVVSEPSAAAGTYTFDYAGWTGTSFAAPILSGIAAIKISQWSAASFLPPQSYLGSFRDSLDRTGQVPGGWPGTLDVTSTMNHSAP